MQKMLDLRSAIKISKIHQLQTIYTSNKNCQVSRDYLRKCTKNLWNNAQVILKYLKQKPDGKICSWRR